MSNVGPLGCIPSRLAIGKSPDGRCVAFDNDLVLGFNVALKSLLLELTRTLPGSMFIYGNAYDAVVGLIDNPAPQGKIESPTPDHTLIASRSITFLDRFRS